MSTPTSLRLLTLNTHKGFTAFNRRFVLPALREAIHGCGADIVLLQEVIGEHQLHAAKVQEWPAVPQYEYLADTLWPQHAYGRNAIYTEGHHGNAVLSKPRILRWQNTDVSVRGPEQRGLLHCVLDVPGWPALHLFCVHLGLLEAHRREQLRRLCALIEAEVPADAALVVGGDFNDWWGSAHRRLAAGAHLQEVFIREHGRAARSFPARLPLLRLDRIYVRGLSARNARVLSGAPWSGLSDHAGLIVDLQP